MIHEALERRVAELEQHCGRIAHILDTGADSQTDLAALAQEVVDRAEAAEARLAEALAVLGPFASAWDPDTGFRGEPTKRVGARDFLNAHDFIRRANKERVMVDPEKGDYVIKDSGDCHFQGIVVCAFNKRSGARRYIVEDARGLLMIMSKKQLKIVSQKK